ncbi:MAG: sterol desaturase family protein [Planctomycetota bacterium]
MNAGLAFALLALVFVPLERLHRANAQPVLRRGYGVDLLFFAGQYLVWFVPALAVLSLAAQAIETLPLTGVQRSVGQLPIALQALLALLVADGAMYWFHRASHRHRFLWRFHRVHHTARDVDWLAAHREHPVDNVLTRLVENLPPLVLGVPLEVLAGLVVFRGLWALFIHANVTLDPGPLRYLLGAPRLHRWHHEVDHHARVNFANLCPLMDLIFGTYHDPRRQPERFGVHERVREGYLGLLLEPFGILRPLRRRASVSGVAGVVAPAADGERAGVA